ncbi:hypothetical protein LTR85_009195 [Meristemomyces frigidus]|nr:hypothetical protein LTR85_009195 [Meristemomyces frigidus]
MTSSLEEEDEHQISGRRRLADHMWGEHWASGHQDLSYGFWFVTENGYLGIGSNAYQVGDVIAKVLGAGAPWVLRPRSGRYILLDNVILFDLMNKHVEEMVEAGEVSFQTIVVE